MSGLRIKDLDVATEADTSDQLPIDGTGFASAKSVTADVLFSQLVGANYERTLNVDADLSTVKQLVKVGGVSSALKVSTTAVESTGALLGVNLTVGTIYSNLFQVDEIGVGFNGTTPIAKPTVTGSRAGNAALASLLTALANLGLITNSTSA